MSHDCTVFLVDDDRSLRDALSLLLAVNGYRISVFADADSFLRAMKQDWHGCVLTDIRMPGMDGLALQAALKNAGCPLPVIVMTGYGDVESARQAFRAQAVDFLEKPINEERLMSAIERAFSTTRSEVKELERLSEFRRRSALLTPREQETMQLVIAGQNNREIAKTMSISLRTVEVHKARLMEKLQVSSLPELMRLFLG